jgi:hypothetical protein
VVIDFQVRGLCLIALGLGCWVLGVGCGVWGVGCGVWGVGCRRPAVMFVFDSEVRGVAGEEIGLVPFIAQFAHARLW